MIVHRPILSWGPIRGLSGCPFLLKPVQACSAVSTCTQSIGRLGASHCRKSRGQQSVPLFLLDKLNSQSSGQPLVLAGQTTEQL